MYNVHVIWLLHVSAQPRFLGCEFQALTGTYVPDTHYIATSYTDYEIQLESMESLNDFDSGTGGSGLKPDFRLLANAHCREVYPVCTAEVVVVQWCTCSYIYMYSGHPVS